MPDNDVTLQGSAIKWMFHSAKKQKLSIFSNDGYDNWTCWVGKLTIIHNNKTTVMWQEAYCANKVFSLILYFICNSNVNDVEDKATGLVCSTVEFACVQKQVARKLTRFDVTWGRDRLPTPDSSTQQPPASPLPPPPAPPHPRAVKTKDRYKSPTAVPKPLPLRQQREKKRGWPCRPDVMRHAPTCPCSVLVRQFTGNHSYSCAVWGSHACWKRLGRGPSADFPTGCDITQSGPASAHNSSGRRLKVTPVICRQMDGPTRVNTLDLQSALPVNKTPKP